MKPETNQNQTFETLLNVGHRAANPDLNGDGIISETEYYQNMTYFDEVAEKMPCPNSASLVVSAKVRVRTSFLIQNGLYSLH